MKESKRWSLCVWPLRLLTLPSTPTKEQTNLGDNNADCDERNDAYEGNGDLHSCFFLTQLTHLSECSVYSKLLWMPHCLYVRVCMAICVSVCCPNKHPQTEGNCELSYSREKCAHFVVRPIHFCCFLESFYTPVMWQNLLFSSWKFLQSFEITSHLGPMLPPGKKSSRRSQRWRCFCFHIKESPTLLTDTSFSLTRSMFTDLLSLKPTTTWNRRCREGLTARISMSLHHGSSDENLPSVTIPSKLVPRPLIVGHLTSG